MLEATISDGLHELWPKKEVFEASGVDASKLKMVPIKGKRFIG